MECFTNSLNFVINEDHDLVIQNHKAHIKYLFGVTVNLENAQQNKRWIKINGREDQLSKAKEYILALANPEIISTVDHVWGSPHFTEERKSDIERKSSAVLTRQDTKSKGVQIQGSAFSVTVARSLIEEALSGNASGVSSKEPVLVFEEDKEDFSVTDSRLFGNSRADPKSYVVAEPQVDKLNKIFKDRLGSTLMSSASKDKESNNLSFPNASTSQPRNAGSTLSPHSREQQAYLRSMALDLKYDKDIVEEALLMFDMNDVVPPANFIYVVEERSRNKAKKSKQQLLAGSNYTTDIDASVICLDSSDEETEVMRPFGLVNQHTRQSGLNDTIVLSSDEEQENEKPNIMKSSLKKVPDSEMYKAQSNHLTGPHVAQGTPTETSFQQSEEMLLRQEYLNGLMTATPKGPKTGPRYIVIDGSNVAMSHGNNVRFSAHGIEICIKHFLSKGHNSITAFVPEWRRYTNQISSADRAILEKLNKAGFVKFTPARRVGNRTIASYDDRFILNLAVEEEGVIVSNDQYRDLQDERASYKDVVTNRLLQFTFVGNHFMPPDDPMGRFGPSLDQFLNHTKQPRRTGMGAIAASTAPPRDCHDGTAPPSSADENQEAVRRLPLRTKSETEKLFLELMKIFPKAHQLSCIRKVLENHKRETDLNRLSVYCINAMSSS
ncbi:NEDD4-binding protein 1 [Elysia marginata]|uniref:NEDD4-binding protein 1 n=1 Tax=Elysia marginata TaxID=1093978 RepID=A0AAV4I7D0_9GAST|nr:NEDD4-binding protein 1 [Elysia marginata]